MVCERLKDDKQNLFAVGVAHRIVIRGGEPRNNGRTINGPCVVNKKIAVVRKVWMKRQAKQTALAAGQDL